MTKRGKTLVDGGGYISVFTDCWLKMIPQYP